MVNVIILVGIGMVLGYLVKPHVDNLIAKFHK